MPAPLLEAHQPLDRAVDRCYRPEPFPNDRHRVEYLFALCAQLTAPARRPRQAGPQRGEGAIPGLASGESISTRAQARRSTIHRKVL
jgi:hypothetical protein